MRLYSQGLHGQASVKRRIHIGKGVWDQSELQRMGFGRHNPPAVKRSQQALSHGAGPFLASSFCPPTPAWGAGPFHLSWGCPPSLSLCFSTFPIAPPPLPVAGFSLGLETHRVVTLWVLSLYLVTQLGMMWRVDYSLPLWFLL